MPSFTMLARRATRLRALSGTRLLELACIAVTLAGAATQAWVSRYELSSVDGVSYLDLGEAYLHGSWHEVVNAYWNPLYAVLAGAMVAIVRPSPRMEFPTIEALDYAIFVVCLAAFRWFLGELRRACRRRAAGTGTAVPPDWAWIVGGYTVFAWSSFHWIALTSNTPDMAAAAVLYVAAGLLLRLEERPCLADRVRLGLVLAIGYYCRTVILLVGWVAAGALAWRGRRTRPAGRPLATAAVLLVLTLPFIVTLSVARGHPTIGDNAMLNHAWLANPGNYIIPDTGWLGGPPGYGTPRHPPRLLWDAPETLEFATPIGGTFPLWTDPSYWYQGLRYHFDAAAEWRSFADNVIYVARLFGTALAIATAAALLANRRPLAGLRRLWAYRLHWLVPSAGVALHMIGNDLLVQYLPAQPPSRYIATFAVLIGGAVAACAPWGELRRPRLTRRAAGLALLATSGAALFVVGRDARHEWLRERPIPAWVLAEQAAAAGIQPGMRVAIVGSKAEHAYWARLARARIVAQIRDEAGFWRSAPEVRDAIDAVLGRSGVQAIVASWIPATPPPDGWRRLTAAVYGVHLLGPAAAALTPDAPAVRSAADGFLVLERGERNVADPPVDPGQRAMRLGLVRHVVDEDRATDPRHRRRGRKVAV